MFTVEERDRVRGHVLDLARGDARVEAGAEVGSLALGGGDRWSDLDLTFGIADEVPPTDVLDDWERDLASQFGAVRLFDLVAGAATYRVFLLRDHLQLDVSVSPAARFRPAGPRFKLLFGEAQESVPHEPHPRGEVLGWAVLWARYARVCIERGNWWQAEYAIAHLRDRAMQLVCVRLGLPADHAKGFDDLPNGVLAAFEEVLVRSLDRSELVRALGAGMEALLKECDVARDDDRIIHRLREMRGS